MHGRLQNKPSRATWGILRPLVANIGATLRPTRRPSRSSADIQTQLRNAQALPNRAAVRQQALDTSLHSRESPNKRAGFASAPSASSARPSLFSDRSKVGLIASRPNTGSADDADDTDGVFSIRAHPDHSRPCAAFSGKRDF